MRAPTFTQPQHDQALRDQLIGVLLALCIAAVVTVSLIVASRWLPIEHVTIVYLIPVIVAALRWGAVPALVAGVSGLAAPAFFYEPIYDFRVHSPAHLVDMMMFVTVHSSKIRTVRGVPCRAAVRRRLTLAPQLQTA